MKYTDQGPYTGNHWFWRDGRRNHGHDSNGQAYVRWKVKPTAKSGYQTHGEFNVARLLVEAREGAIPPRVRYVSTCDLSQCINPAHWRRASPASPWRLQVFDAAGVWQLVRVSTEAPAERETVVHVLHAGVVHLVSVLPLELRTHAAMRAACGAELLSTASIVTSSDLTCERCV